MYCFRKWKIREERLKEQDRQNWCVMPKKSQEMSWMSSQRVMVCDLPKEYSLEIRLFIFVLLFCEWKTWLLRLECLMIMIMMVDNDRDNDNDVSDNNDGNNDNIMTWWQQKRNDNDDKNDCEWYQWKTFKHWWPDVHTQHINDSYNHYMHFNMKFNTCNINKC